MMILCMTARPSNLGHNQTRGDGVSVTEKLPNLGRQDLADACSFNVLLGSKAFDILWDSDAFVLISSKKKKNH